MTKASDTINIGKYTIKNRMTMAPTVKFDYAGEDGCVTDKHIEHYKKRAEGGVGLICVEATAVSPDGRFAKNHLGLWEDPQIEGHKIITDNCHKQDVVVLIQLNHTGIGANPECGRAIGPSAVPTRDGNMSDAMTISEIHDMQQRFIESAIRAQKAGYDGIQLHGCHGYLINQFVSKKTNLRDDEYGGDIPGRARFASEIIQGIRQACGEDYLISVRTVGADPDHESAIAIAEEYVKSGCNYLQVSHGIEEAEHRFYDDALPYSHLCSLGVHFHEHFAGRIPVSSVGGIMTPELVDHLIENDLTDTVDLARSLLADPKFPQAVLSGSTYTKCFQCKQCQYGPFMPHLCPTKNSP